MKGTFYCCFILYLLLCTVKAQDSTGNAKIDSLLLYQKKMLNQQENMYDETVRYKEPLENKKYGIEINPAYLLLSSARSYFVHSGGFSFFDIDRHAAVLNESHKNSGQIVHRENMRIYNLEFERIKDKESSSARTSHGQVVI
ncbi:MAG: hypothetical protein WAV76_07535 [Bacteroidota bacterium]